MSLRDKLIEAMWRAVPGSAGPYETAVRHLDAVLDTLEANAAEWVAHRFTVPDPGTAHLTVYSPPNGGENSASFGPGEWGVIDMSVLREGEQP